MTKLELNLFLIVFTLFNLFINLDKWITAFK